MEDGQGMSGSFGLFKFVNHFFHKCPIHHLLYVLFYFGSACLDFRNFSLDPSDFLHHFLLVVLVPFDVLLEHRVFHHTFLPPIPNLFRNKHSGSVASTGGLVTEAEVIIDVATAYDHEQRFRD